MPVYAYACRDCGNAFEIRQEFSDSSLTVCESCGGRLRKQFGTVGVTFNGSGFYRTDSKNPPKGGEAPAKAPATAPTTGNAA